VSVFVKVCGLRDAATAQAAAEAGADAIGFVFAESVRQVTPAEANVAARQLPAGTLRVAVMRHPSNAAWQEVLEVFGPDVLQTDAGDFASLAVPDSIRRWPVIREGEDVSELPAEFVYEGVNSGAGETVDWTQATAVAARGRMILAGGLSPGNVASAIGRVRPWGVDVSSGVESAPGSKDMELIREFIGAVRAGEGRA
jgi:phosphoribosylanthranilate isomerase